MFAEVNAPRFLGMGGVEGADDVQPQLEGLSVLQLEALTARLHEISARFEDGDGDGDDEALGGVEEDLPDALVDGPGDQGDVPGGELLLEPPEVEGPAQVREILELAA